MAYWSYKSELDFVHKMRDPIYGFIPLTQLEMEIIDTPIFQRLRRIHQLALTKYVYPSAEHSRFVHSIGVMHCASLIYEGIFNHKMTKIWPRHMSEPLQLLRLAALLHDVGHLPFSHATEEDLLPDGITHEDLSAYIIINYPPITAKIREAGYDPELVSMLLSKTPVADFRLEHDIISGNLDADRADYLLRDSKACGVCYGEYDFPRFLQMFAAMLGDDRHYKLCVGEDDIWQAESLLIARYHYNLQVPFHRTRSGFDFALKQFIKSIEGLKPLTDAKGKEIQNVDFETFVNFDDYAVMEKAKDSTNKWAAYLLRREHLVTIMDTTSLIDGGQEKLRVALAVLNKAGFKHEEDYFLQRQAVVILKAPTKEQMDEPAEQDKEDTSPPYGNIYLLCKDKDEPIDICERSWIFKQFREKPLNILRLYATIEKREEMKKIIQEGAA